MSKRELLLKSITYELSVWEVNLRNLGSLNLLDAHHLSEDSIAELLNTIFDYELLNKNAITVNFPAIDLGDTYNQICVQVTSQKSKSKIQSSIDKFLELELDRTYNELFVVVLGQKQKTYSEFTTNDTFQFEARTHILDFNDILNQLRNKPLRKLEKVQAILKDQNYTRSTEKTNPNVSKVKDKLKKRDSLQKDLLMEVDRKDWDKLCYEPWHKFSYSQILVRSIDDETWPEVDANPNGLMSTWFKCELYDFYENGIELITSLGAHAIFNTDGNWDLLDFDDPRKEDTKYQRVTYHPFGRIPFEFIVKCDMQPDPYHGLPTLYVEYKNEGTPYEEMIYGIMGSYKEQRLTYYFDAEKRRKLP